MAVPTMPTIEDWRAQVDKELAGAAFDKLVTATPEGFAILPLYTEARVDPGLPGAAPFTRGGSAEARPFQICMRANAGNIVEQLDGGADAVWIELDDQAAVAVARARGVHVVGDLPIDGVGDVAGSGDRAIRGSEDGASDGEASDADEEPPMWIGFDFIGDVLRGRRPAPFVDDAMLGSLAAVVQDAPDDPATRMIRVSGLPFHDAGADAADELALMLASAAAYLRALVDHGVAIDAASASMWAQISVGRDTFGELCKLRALRVCWHKLFAAAGARDTALTALHAVASSRTQSQRDPWVNMLRVTTEVFAAALGGAQLVTPSAFDEALGPASAHGLRVARNTALVLREESHLGRVIDAAGGSYYIEARTDALAREAWARFTQIERDGGIAKLIVSGGLRERLARSWAARAAAIAKRKEPVLGVSEFANLDEQLPAEPPAAAAAPPPAPALVPHRDAEGFEALRGSASREVAIVAIGPPAEHRARVGFATALFATVGLRAHDLAAGSVPDIACLCGSDERYATEAVAHANELRAAGARKIVLAGRPGALEAELRKAGVDAFIYVGCDVLATLTELTR